MSPADPPAPVFAALGDPTRCGLLATLSTSGSRSIAALSADTLLTRQAVTKHLKVLERAGLVVHARAGRETRYAARLKPLGAARDWIEAVGMQWERALGRLGSFVED